MAEKETNQEQKPAGQEPASSAATTDTSETASSTSSTQEPGARSTEPSQQQSQQVTQQSLPDDLPAEDDDAAWAKLPKWVRDLRAENATRRKRLQDAEKELGDSKTRLKEFEDREKTDSEKMADRLQAFEKEVADKNLEVRDLRVRILATEMGIIDSEAAQRLIDWDDIGSAEEDLKQALSDLLEKKPWLKAPAAESHSSQNGGPRSNPTNPERPLSETTPITREYLQSLTPEQMDEMWKSGDLKKALAENRIK